MPSTLSHHSVKLLYGNIVKPFTIVKTHAKI